MFLVLFKPRFFIRWNYIWAFKGTQMSNIAHDTRHALRFFKYLREYISFAHRHACSWSSLNIRKLKTLFQALFVSSCCIYWACVYRWCIYIHIYMWIYIQCYTYLCKYDHIYVNIYIIYIYVHYFINYIYLYIYAGII